MNKKTNIAAELMKNRRMIGKLAGNDFRMKFAGSYLGVIWAFIQPVVTVLVYWFVFEIGFRTPNTNLPVPFLLYLIAGLVPWFYFQEALTGGTSALLNYDYLVKKVVFEIEVLPPVKIISAMFTHLFFIGFLLFLYLCYGRIPDLYNLQILYYSAGLTILVLGLCYLTSSVVVFFRDLSQVIGIMLQVGVWMTPIMWVADEKLANHPWVWKLLKLNPVYYVVTGYRDAFIYKNWFWERPLWTLYFWGFTIGIFCLGSWVFTRLRVHFADVL